MDPHAAPGAIAPTRVESYFETRGPRVVQPRSAPAQPVRSTPAPLPPPASAASADVPASALPAAFTGPAPLPAPVSEARSQLVPAPAATPAPAKAIREYPVLLVMESAGGVRAAGALRSALHTQRGIRVVSLAEVTPGEPQDDLRPAAILTVSAVPARAVSVVYWDLFGNRDALSSPAPARADQLDAVVLALASALLDRHRAQLTGLDLIPASALAGESVRPSTLYAVLGRYSLPFPRSNVALRFEDF